MKPIVDGLKPKYQDRVSFESIDMYESQNEAVVKQFNVQVHPTFISVNAQGQQADQIIGGTDEQRFTAAIEKALQ